MKEIHVTMFNDFTLSYNGNTIAFNIVATRQMCGLLQMLVYHKKGISKEELIEELWQEATNPLNSLKYSIFRLRATLNEIACFQSLTLVSTIKNGYVFAPNIKIITDYEKVDDYYIIMKCIDSTKKEVTKSAKKIIEIYKGPFFMSNSSFWCIKIRAYYRTIYEEAFTIVCDNFLDNHQERSLLPIIQHAIKMDEFHDEAYVYYLRVLNSLGEYEEAMRIYKQVDNLYESELGQPPSINIKSMYHMIAAKEEELLNVEILKNKLHTDIQLSNALYCDYESFTYIYHTLCNLANHDHKTVLLIIFQLTCKLEDKNQYSHMIKLKNIMCSFLPSSAILSKINRVQFISLLPCENIELGYTIVQRITTAFYKKVSRQHVRLHYYINSITDFDDGISKE